MVNKDNSTSSPKLSLKACLNPSLKVSQKVSPKVSPNPSLNPSLNPIPNRKFHNRIWLFPYHCSVNMICYDDVAHSGRCACMLSLSVKYRLFGRGYFILNFPFIQPHFLPSSASLSLILFFFSSLIL